MKTKNIREKFFKFFEERDHTRVASSSLIPAEDPTLLFTNAGMNQFKDLFLGKEKRNYARATSIQKCVRAGGKHNDLDNVGFTKRHLTFFEMMGNFSFGDYFKKEAIRYTWDFLTKVMGIPAEKLVVTVFETDDEAYDIWHKDIGLPKDHIFRCGEKDNFWSMGDTGPCGPCSEILYDKGKEFGPDCTDPNECEERFLEIWNNVFMQYNRQADSKLVPLKQTGVDTGLGLERLALVMQNKDTVYETDLFSPIIKKIEELTELKYEKQPDDIKAAFNVLADHIRSSCLIIADGCTPSNEGRGYVLRKIIRRAALFDQKLRTEAIFPLLVDTFIDDMGTIYPELQTNRELIKNLIRIEVEKFAENLKRGQQILEDSLEANKETKKISGNEAFKLYDTFGFPYEITEIVAHERGYTVNRTEFESLMKKQRAQSNVKDEKKLTITLDPSIKTTFTGYEEFAAISPIQAIIKNDKLVNSVKEENECWVIPKKSPFYVECGGQIGDEGIIVINDEIVPVLDLKNVGNAIAIKIHAPSKISVGQEIAQKVDVCRLDTMKNHTATHLLQSALIKLLGKQIKQSGSLVTHDYLRFDFNFHENLTPGMIKELEDTVNQKIWDDIEVKTRQTTLDEAKKLGIIAHFGEKYNPEAVRVIDATEFSRELCGGTHVNRTGEIGCFKITDVSAISAGTKRITAITGPKALELFQSCFRTVKAVSQEYKVQPDEVYETVEHQIELTKKLHKEVAQLKKQLVIYQLPELLNDLETINVIPFLYLEQHGSTINDLRELAQSLSQKKEGFYFAISTVDGKSNFVATIHPTLKKKVNLKSLAQFLKEKHNLRGGGSLTIIQGGGDEIKNIKDEIKNWLKNNK